jgi:hypothetical protein
MTYAPEPAGTHRIDVGEHIARAYRTLFDNVPLAVELALIPYLIILAAELVAVLIPGGMASRAVAGLVDALALLLIGSIFTVRWHRFVLLEERVAGSLIPPGWATFVITEIKIAVLLFVGWLVMLALAMLPPHFITLGLSALGTIALAFLAARLSLLFPAAAIERPMTLRAGWDLLEGNYWRLFACVLACYLPFVIVQMLVMWIGALFPSLFWIVFAAVHLAIMLAGIAVIAALLSHIYRDIAEP